MALCHYPCPEEIDVFTGPHLRMKQLVYEALEKVGVFIIHELFLFRNLAVFLLLTIQKTLVTYLNFFLSAIDLRRHSPHKILNIFNLFAMYWLL